MASIPGVVTVHRKKEVTTVMVGNMTQGFGQLSAWVTYCTEDIYPGSQTASS